MDTYRSEIVLKCGKIENKDAAILNIASNLAANQFLISLAPFFSSFFFLLEWLGATKKASMTQITIFC